MEPKLKEELEILKSSSNLGLELSVFWEPDNGNPLAGEVVGKKIRIYESNESKAVETLRHEFLDYALSQAIKPYRAIANTLVKLVNTEAYTRKEEMVEGLNRLLSTKTMQNKEIIDDQERK